MELYNSPKRFQSDTIALRAACVITIFAFLHKRRLIPPGGMGGRVPPSMGGASGEDGGGHISPHFCKLAEQKGGDNKRSIFYYKLQAKTAQITCLEIDSAIAMDWCKL